ncbi:MAG: hypothetical protein OXK73_04360 [Rhodospirillaceae bacterium]|nr:hypothetical protein [Rhodospirillaceae bacterium]
MRAAIIMIAALALIATSASAEEVSDRDRFKLWNGCRPVDLVVEGLTDDSGEIGLHREDIETAVRSRLRGARIYDNDASPYLYVNVNVVGRAYAIGFEFTRYVEVAIPFWLKPEGMGQLTGFASTWVTGSTGTHGSSAGFILSAVARHGDKFVDEYLRVNADAC